MSGWQFAYFLRDLMFHRPCRSDFIFPYATRGCKFGTTRGKSSTSAFSRPGTQVTTRIADRATNPALHPDRYRDGNSFQREANLRALDKFGTKFDSAANKQLRYLDVGCATGDFTRDVLLNHTDPPPTIVAVDISPEMIDHAKQRSPHPNITYDILDIATREISGILSKYGQFDRVYSFYCLNWVKDQATALRNIASLMKNDGECLLLFPVKSSCYTVWRDIAKLPRWNAYAMVSVMSYVTEVYHLFSNGKQVFLFEVG